FESVKSYIVRKNDTNEPIKELFNTSINVDLVTEEKLDNYIFIDEKNENISSE
ncbi:MAG: hypothetical protein MHPSP_004682, partial [Paramarteilia canceri]